MILAKILGNGKVHIAELTAVAFIKDDDYALIKNCVRGILFDEGGQLLDGGDDDFCTIVLQLALEDSGGGVAVGRALFKAVVLLHSLVIQILAVYHKQHLVDIIELRGKLRCFEGSQRFTAARGVPDIAAACNRAELFVVVGDLNTV